MSEKGGEEMGNSKLSSRIHPLDHTNLLFGSLSFALCLNPLIAYAAEPDLNKAGQTREERPVIVSPLVAQQDGAIRGLAGKCLDVAGANPANGTPIILWDCHGEANQRWTLASTCAPQYGTFRAGNWPPACWRPYADTSPFNTKVPNNPTLLPNSSAIVARVFGTNPADPYLIPRIKRPNHITAPRSGTGGEPTYYTHFVSRQDDPEYELHCTMVRWGTCPIEGHKIRIPGGAQVEGNRPAQATNSDAYRNEPDAHLTVIDQDSGYEYDLWQVHKNPIQGGGRLEFSWGGRTRIGGSGVAEAGNATAAHFGNLAGRIRAEELAANRIDHALFIVIDCDNGGPPLPPAKGKGRPCEERFGHPDANVNAPPMGAHFWLDMTEAEIDGLNISTWKKTILKAMHEYGAFLGDTGAQGYFALEAEGGNQYLSLGAYEDQWWTFGQNNGWEFFAPDDAFVGKLYGDPGVDWDAAIWSRMRVLQPCDAEGRPCPASAPPQEGCVEQCEADRDACMASVGEPGGPLPRECANQYVMCLRRCGNRP